MAIRVVFMGTPQFSVSTLETLLAAPDIEVLGVLTQPDKPAGRGNKLTPSPIKLLALENALPVQQPKSLRKDIDVIQWLRDQAPDYFVTIAFGQILSQEVLDIPKCGTVNVHASLLPAYRGANPIQWAVLDGQAETGLTTMLTDIGVDTGAMLLKEALAIGAEETAESVAIRLSEIAGPLLLKTLREHAEGGLQALPQDDALATHAPKRKKEDAILDWALPAEKLHRLILGQQPWPGALTYLDQLPVKILQSRLDLSAISETQLPPGSILGIGTSGVLVQTGTSPLELLMVQPSGKRAMSARDWALGLRLNQASVGQYCFAAPK